jgi:hypothetical protein
LKIPELLGLLVRDVTLTGEGKGTVKVRTAKIPGQPKEPREEVMDNDLADRVRKYVEDKDLRPNDPLFPNKKGDKYRDRSGFNK